MNHIAKTRFTATLFIIMTLCATYARKPSKKADVTFTDDLGRTVSIQKTEKVAALQGSLASLWILSGGSLAAATSDCFIEPPEMSENQAQSFNKTWNTSGFKAHQKGIFAYLNASQSTVTDVGIMMSPNVEKIIASGAEFVILSTNIQGHKKILGLLENVGITCAFFDYDDFSSYVRIMKILTDITGRKDLYEQNVLSQSTAIEKIISVALEKSKKSSPTILALRASSGKVEAKSSENLAAATMLKKLGCTNIADTNSAYKENLSMEKIIADDPDFIFVTTMGSNEAKALSFMEETLKSNPAWKDLNAVKNGAYFVLPRELFHFKPGTRWSESYRVLSELLYGND
ncbi:MAG: ABC transporter substrate-binding protein [Treponema sp.]|nr:ABC transporter substrate-binding protein [Treponema sp.]